MDLSNQRRLLQGNKSGRNRVHTYWIRVSFLYICLYQFSTFKNLLLHHESPTKLSPNNAFTERQMDQLLIPSSELGRMDYFSDSWLMNKANLLKIDVHKIITVEDACFQVIDRNVEMNKMFVDWTNLAVEHLSKWWKSLQVLVQVEPGMFNKVISMFRLYLEAVKRSSRETSSPLALQQTIAMVAFQSYDSVKFGPDRGHQLTAHSLAATIASLYQVGFERIVVTGYYPSDESRVREAFLLLDATLNDETAPIEAMTLQVGRTIVVYTRLQESWIKTNHVAVNVPRGTLIGMHTAISGKMGEGHTKEWLGDDIGQWKYFYLTEPDTILNVKPEILPLIRQGLDNDWIFFPHRFQPIPHEADLPVDHAFMRTGRYVSGSVPPFSNITKLANPWSNETKEGSGASHCCDTGIIKPGRTEEFGTKQRPCGQWWWACGFTDQDTIQSEIEVRELHKRLVPYPMMSLQGGTGVVVLGTEMGRRCLPSSTPCLASDIS